MKALLIPPGSESHVLILAGKLMESGVVRRGGFTYVDFQHDGWCLVLRTNSNLDCRCDVWAVIGGATFTLSELVALIAREAGDDQRA